jgi:hypothetical protein
VRACELTQAAERDGLTTVRSWLRGHRRLSPAAASRIVSSGRALEHLPAVAAAFAAGEVTGEAVAVLAQVTTPERLAAAAEQGVDLGAVDEGLALAAATQPVDTVRGVVQRYVAAAVASPLPRDGQLACCWSASSRSGADFHSLGNRRGPRARCTRRIAVPRIPRGSEWSIRASTRLPTPFRGLIRTSPRPAPQ